MVHTRINERTANPNPYISFITALPPFGSNYGAAEDVEAKELLRALAAQLKPVMKTHGFTVNSFEEYESNKVFLGRNWNNGETVELVLRDSNGAFYHPSRLLGVFCHELAHIKHMNHSAAFHTLRRQLSAEVADLQFKGYYGDGYWSAGTRLSDSQTVSGVGWNAQGLPEYTCGGAYSQSRNSALPSRRRRRPRKVAGPSLSTGAQIAKQRKAGSRVTSKTAFGTAGKGTVLNENVEKGAKGSGFRKQAGSQRAREERAIAAERRLLHMQGKQEPEKQGESSSSSESDPEENDFEPETDKERLKRMRDLMGEDDLGALRDVDDIILASSANPAYTDPPGVSRNQGGRADGAGMSQTDDEGFKRQDFSSTGAQGTQSKTRQPRETSVEAQVKERSPTSSHGDNLNQRQKRRPGEIGRSEGPSSKRQKRNGTQSIADMFRTMNKALEPPSTFSSTSSSKNMVNQEIQQRSREALGMDRPRRLGDRDGSSTDKEWTCHLCTFANLRDHDVCSMCQEPRRGSSDALGGWTCSACTYENSAGANACEICDRPRT